MNRKLLVVAAKVGRACLLHLDPGTGLDAVDPILEFYRLVSDLRVVTQDARDVQHVHVVIFPV